jgi:peptide-methionine (S)-S-oxide reductase
MLFSTRNKLSLPSAEDALRGRDAAIPVPNAHTVLGTPLTPPFPDGIEVAYFGLGCLWGAERAYWS